MLPAYIYGLTTIPFFHPRHCEQYIEKAAPVSLYFSTSYLAYQKITEEIPRMASHSCRSSQFSRSRRHEILSPFPSLLLSMFECSTWWYLENTYLATCLSVPDGTWCSLSDRILLAFETPQLHLSRLVCSDFPSWQDCLSSALYKTVVLHALSSCLID